MLDIMALLGHYSLMHTSATGIIVVRIVGPVSLLLFELQT